MRKSQKKYPIVLEFNGLPGSGKTTIAKQLIEELRGNGVCVSDYNLESKKYSKKLWIVGFFLNFPTSGKYMQLLWRVVRCSGVSKRKIKYWLASVGDFANKLHCYNNSNMDCIICDQGIMQEILSVVHVSECNVKPYFALMQFLHKIFPTFVGVNMEINVDRATKQVMERTNGRSPVDGLEPEKARDIQQKEADNLTKIRDAMYCDQIFVRYSTVADEVQQIKEYMKQTAQISQLK